MTVSAAQASAPCEGDLELARRVSTGDYKAFEYVMRRHNRMLYRAARGILGDDAEAEDCLQSAYLLAYRSMGLFAGQAKLSTWLARIVVNEALGRKRRAARSGVVIPFDNAVDAGSAASPPAADAIAAHTPGPEAEASGHELRSLIERRIDGLPEVFRSVFVLRAVEELSVEETAQMLQIPEATVRTRYFRARGLLRESLAREMDIAFDGAFQFEGAQCDRIVAAVLAGLRSTQRAD
jgi:RNA polymerase sigma-70 factor (ECF subfamily)